MPRPATLEELLLRQLRDFAESSGLADVVPVEATLASAELLQMGVEQAEETKLKLQVAARLGGGPHNTVYLVGFIMLSSHAPLCFALQGACMCPG